MMKKLSNVIENIMADIARESVDYGPKREFGLTEGQVLHFDTFTEKLKMVPCWMKLYITQSDTGQPYTFHMKPMLAVSPKHYDRHDRNSLDVADPDKGFLDYMVSISAFGGKTLVSKCKNPVFPYGISSEKGIRMLESNSDIEVISRYEAAVLGDCGELILQTAKNFFAPQPGETSFDKGKRINTYADYPIWLPCVSEDEVNRLFFAAEDTCKSATLIPTLWLQGENTYKYFYDLAGDWQSHKGSVSIEIGPFIVSHHYEKGEWYTQTATIPI